MPRRKPRAVAKTAGQRRRSPGRPQPRRAAKTCTRREVLGRGVAGVVYKTCCGYGATQNCSYATKVFTTQRAFQAAEREMRLQAAVAKAGLAPRVVKAGCRSGECAIVMERVRTTLDEYVAAARHLTDAQQRAIIHLLERVAGLGIDHGDVHSGNIAVDRPFRLRMIDFSEAHESRSVNVHAQVGKLVGDLGVRFPALRFPALEAYAMQGHARASSSSCQEEDRFLAYVKAQTGLDVGNPDIEDALLDIWMNGPSNCEGLLRKVRRRYKV